MRSRGAAESPAVRGANGWGWAVLLGVAVGVTTAATGASATPAQASSTGAALEAPSAARANAAARTASARGDRSAGTDEFPRVGEDARTGEAVRIDEAMHLHAAPPTDDALEARVAALEARVAALTAELRCPVCRNETVAASTVPLAADMRREVRDRLRRGEGEASVVAALRERYGDAVLYHPPLTTRTALLWAAPGLLLAAGVLALGHALRPSRRRRPQPD